MYTDTTLYTYHEIPERGNCGDCCNGHTSSEGSEGEDEEAPHKHLEKGGKHSEKKHLNNSEKNHLSSEKSQNGGLVGERRTNLALSYDACKKSMFVGSCKSCAEKEILHL